MSTNFTLSVQHWDFVVQHCDIALVISTSHCFLKLINPHSNNIDNKGDLKNAIINDDKINK